MDNKGEKGTDALAKLRMLLQGVPAGRLNESLAYEVSSLLGDCWDSLSGSSEENTTADKVWSRMEDVEWKPPFVCFRIERHGAMAYGSSRAELHDWAVNIDEGTAACSGGRFRQIRPMDARWDAAAAAHDIADKMRADADDERLRWSHDRQRVTVLVGKFITACNKQTLAGRRKRFRKTLQETLRSDEWVLMTGTAPNTFRKPQ